MMLNIDHIGIAVKELANAVPLYERLLNSQCYKTEIVEGENVTTSFLTTGQTKIELLQSNTAEGVIANFIAKKGEGVHHIAFEVDNIELEMARLKSEGFTLLSEKPKLGADNKLVCFIHPKDVHGVLIEICQSIITQ